MTAPLADIMRPKTIEEMVGQTHLLSENKPLYNIIKSKKVPNMIFYGPPGVGKTTLARIIANGAGMPLHKLNGTTASTADIRAIISESNSLVAQNGVLLYLDEIQYLNKKQQQSLLEFIENGSITLIASTTENPYFYVYGAILSRSTVFEFKPVSAEDIIPAIERGFEYMKQEFDDEILVSNGVIEAIAHRCGGDVRKALNAVEASVLGSSVNDSKREITLETARAMSQMSAAKYDKTGDEHYDLMSAYQKSMRGSDPDAAIHYLARLLTAGDLISACRRLMVCACEDVGLANPNIIPIVKSAVDIAMAVGLPEARLALADATIMVAISPKSNSAHDAINEAMADIERGVSGAIPRSLQNKHFDGADNDNPGQFYKYPHDYPNHYVAQQYLPDEIKNKHYYKFGNNKTEQAYKGYMDKIKSNN